MSHRRRRQLTGLATIMASWYGMMAAHELGHALHAWISGGAVERVVLQPFEFSRTELSRNPHPQFVAWGGAVWGCILPVAVLGVTRALRLRHWYIPAFFAGFCLIANGGYLAAGSFIAAGDAGDLLRHGVPRPALMAFGAGTVPLGLWLWHGLGPHFGLPRRESNRVGEHRRPAGTAK